MTKKKVVEPDEDLEDDLEDLEDEVEDEEIETVYPKLEEKSSKAQEELEESPSKGQEELEESPSDISEEEYEEDLDLEIEEIPDFKHVKLNIQKGSAKNDYELDIIGQSHGFCNIFVKHLLDLEGVNIAAYKITLIEPTKIYIRLEKGYKIKAILLKGIESLREKVIEVQNLFKDIM